MNTDPHALLIKNRYLVDEVRRQVKLLAAVNRVVTEVSQSLNLQHTLDTALEVVCEAAQAEAGGISLIDEAAGEIVLRAQRGWLRDFVRERPMRVPLGRGLSGRVISNDEVFVNNNLDETTQFAVPSFRDEHFRSMAMAPMHARGKIIGILSIMSLRPNSFDQATVDMLRNIADTVAVAIDNARLYEIALENQHQLSAVLHSTADGIIATDQSGRIKLVNAAAQDMLLTSESQLIGLPLRDAPIPANIRESLRFALSTREAVDHDRPVTNRAFRVTTDAGRVLSVLASPILVESQLDPARPDGWVIVLQDVTHLQEAELARTEFMKSAAHDIRNPLGTALNALEILRRIEKMSAPPPSNSAEPDEVIEIALNSVQRVRAMIDNLLHLENVQAGVGFALTEVDFDDLIQEISADIYPRLCEKHLRYHVDCEADLPITLADRKQIAQALRSYLDNAIRYAPEQGEVRLRIFVEPPSDPGGDPMLHIEVSDSGPGIPLELQARLFERFYRADSRSTGAGLGLALVRTVAEVHGGRVYVHSGVGQGSVFGMTIRIAPAS
ncbi:MAG: ATP-binding protein [Candidatus Flexifilum sp.]|jgi:PAS domain S-box-containing protein